MLRVALCLSLIVLHTAPSSAQSRFDPNAPNGQHGVALFNEAFFGEDMTRLKCRVDWFDPGLGFDMKVVSGFNVGVPLSEVAGRKNLVMAYIFRVTPVKPAGEPVWFFRQLRAPVIPDDMVDKIKRQVMSTGGRFLLGVGEYRVDWAMVDSEKRACVRSWKLRSKPPQRERLGIVPGFVEQDSGLASWAGPQPAKNGNGKRATIFVNAYPVYPRRHIAQLSGWDRRLLGSALTSTIDGARFSSVRVVVFDLERRSILFEDDDFSGAGFRRLLDALGEADIATIDYSVLKSRDSDYDFLESLLSAETSQERKSDAFIFVTPAWKSAQRKRKVAPEVAQRLPDMHCVVLASRPGLMEGAVIDLVKQVRGRVQTVYQASDLARAASEIRQDLSGGSQ